MTDGRLSQSDLWTLRALVQKAGWGEFMRHVGSLMAEQADRVLRDSEQDQNLSQCSRTVHALNPFFEKCGFFDYRRHEDVPPEHQALLEANPPSSVRKE